MHTLRGTNHTQNIGLNWVIFHKIQHLCTYFYIFGTHNAYMGHNAPHLLKPLPPLITKVETVNTLNKAIQAGMALAELKGIAKLIPNQSMLLNAIIIQEAKDSSEIENIITSTDELYEALNTTEKSFGPQVKEVTNYRSAMIKSFELINKQSFIRINDIIELQKEIIGNDAGIRSTPGTVLKNDKTGEVVYTPPQDKDDIENLLGNFIEHFNNKNPDVSHLIQVGILHFQFESIHPFYDGNGRTGRILNILYLLLNDLIELPILYLSNYIIKNKSEYYKYLNEVNSKDIWENWILFILEAIHITSLRTIDLINRIKTKLEEAIKVTKEKEPKIYSKELIELIFEHPYSKIDYVVSNLNVERKAASRYLKSLEKLGILQSKKIGREIIYINISIMNELKK